MHYDWFTVSNIYEILLLIGRAAVSWVSGKDLGPGTALGYDRIIVSYERLDDLLKIHLSGARSSR